MEQRNCFRISDGCSNFPVWNMLVYAFFILSSAALSALDLKAGNDIHSDNSLVIVEELIWLQEVDKLRDREADAARVVQLDPDSARGHYLLAQIYLRRFKSNPSQLKLLQQASDLGQQAIELDPTSDYGYLIAAQVLDMMGYSDSAINALEGDPKLKMRASWRVPFLKAQLYSGVRTDREVEDLYEKSLQSPEAIKNVIVPYIIASIQARYEDKSGMLSDLRHWRAKHAHRLFDLSIAISYTEQKKYKEAHEIYTQLQLSEPDLYEAAINDALLLYNHFGRTKDAIQILSNLVSSPREIEALKRNLAKAHLARIYIESNQNLDRGRAYLTEVIRESQNPNEWLIFSHKAFEKAKRLSLFVEFLNDIRRTLPGTGFIYALQGEVLSENLALHEKAIESFHSAIILEPNRSDFYNGLGLAYYRMNDMQKALVIFNEATRIDPKDATSRYNEACVLALLGRPNEALGSLRTAIHLDPKLQASAKSDADFRSLWNSPEFLRLILPLTSNNDVP